MTEKTLAGRGGGICPASPPAPCHTAPTRLIHCPWSRKRRPGEPLRPLGWGGSCRWPTSQPSKPMVGRRCPPGQGALLGTPRLSPQRPGPSPPPQQQQQQQTPKPPPSWLQPLPASQGQYLLWALPGDVGLPPCLTPKPSALLLNSGGTRKQLPGTAEKSQVRPAPQLGGAEIRAPLAFLVCNDSAKGAAAPTPDVPVGGDPALSPPARDSSLTSPGPPENSHWPGRGRAGGNPLMSALSLSLSLSGTHAEASRTAACRWRARGVPSAWLLSAPHGPLCPAAREVRAEAAKGPLCPARPCNRACPSKTGLFSERDFSQVTRGGGSVPGQMPSGTGRGEDAL